MMQSQTLVKRLHEVANALNERRRAFPTEAQITRLSTASEIADSRASHAEMARAVDAVLHAAVQWRRNDWKMPEDE